MEIVKKTNARVLVTELKRSPCDIFIVALENDGIEVSITNIGCSVMSVRTPDKNGVMKNIVAGFSDAEAYRINPDYFGCVIGRYANRITDGKFVLNGQVYQLPLNNPPNHLHGGFNGFNYKTWKLEEIIETPTTSGVIFSYLSEDGEEGYPGNLQVSVTYLLHTGGRLEIKYHATTDKATPVNLTNHSYFNLSGFETATILDHQLKINAKKYTEKSERNTATGKLAEVAGTALDFTVSKRIGEGIDQFPADMGYDHNFIPDHSCKDLTIPVAVLSDQLAGRILNVYTDQPGIQVYSGNYWNSTIRGEQGFIYHKYGGIALETQALPDSVNQADFPDTILQPGQQYRSTTIFEFLTVS